MSVEKLISPLIASQFPAFYKTEGPNFIAFVKAYYEWAEQQNNFLQLSRSLYDIKILTQRQQRSSSILKTSIYHRFQNLLYLIRLC